ncbi:hypothetical protein A4A49_08633 [Nicotiana attenuata]|uniref:F-box domain-containing protein n=1 Tax=Nicotiana attenuata TaxID=49451 RepID=A0A1J6IXJ2_NICAT|nr:hypothetical protein A4A49_08633 [Nicotiana attenuata]
MENIMALPCEVLVDILSRVSLKHIHQLKAVSRPWCRTISSPHFRRLYNMKSMHRSPALVVQSGCVCYIERDGIREPRVHITISAMDLAGENEIQNQFSFERVGLKYSSFVSFSLLIFQQKLCIPATGETKDLPDLSLPSYSFDVGYTPSTNSYKIVHLFGANKLSPSYGYNKTGEVLEFGFETLTLTDGGPIPSSWRSLTHREWFSYKVHATCVNGHVIYWLVGNGDEKDLHIISMEIENEEFLTIGCPKEDNNDKPFGHGQLVDLNGSLCFAYYSKELSRVDLFLLKDPKNQTWIKEYKIKLPGMPDKFKLLGYIPPNEDNNGEIIINSPPCLLYNIEGERYRRIPVRSLNRFCVGLYYDRCFSLESTGLNLQSEGD